ncbi:hypothetical protein LHYA1_G003230 [Lachnellula hyalina]|uniref:Ribosomal protein L9 domain-containing protein n=1 Tax=Lachnellula hyalina TaxID=1316788 RepID=A0A8H8R5X9_9HELO|nr:uncharacterized protein LHYA1_G003230 [Lachnellula hyalina]TVY27439.1 hypothetical protein LHYA1_G003230 [Lachnellula hyalina]
MASPLLSRSPQCVSCIRRSAGRFGERRLFPAGQQIRGKKKTARTANKVNALLRENIDGYGKQGTVISVTAGMMRNQWFPQRLAEYATAAKLQELGLKEEDVIQLDNISKSKILADEREVKKAAKAEAKALTKANTEAKGTIQEPVWEPVKPVELELLSPQEATLIIANLLPANLDFYRQPIAVAEPAKKLSPSLQSKASISAAAKESHGPKGKTSIYGSVSTADIAASLKAILAEHEDGARVVLSPEEISFVETEEEGDRVKHLGVFEIDIWLKGAPDAVRRTIKVSAQG